MKLHVNSSDDLTQVSDVPQWVQCCVFVMKDYEHGWSCHASCHSTAVYVLSSGEGRRKKVYDQAETAQLFKDRKMFSDARYWTFANV